MQWKTVAGLLSRLEGVRAKRPLTGALSHLLGQASPEEAKALCYLLTGRLWPPYAGPEFGLDEKLVHLAVARGRHLQPGVVWQRYRELGDLGSLLLEVPDGHASDLSVGQVYQALCWIASQTGPGSVAAKIEGLGALIHHMSQEEAAMLVRIPLRKLRLGVGDALLLDAIAEAYQVRRGLVERAYNLGGDLGAVAEAAAMGGNDALACWRMRAGRPVRMALAERAQDAEEIIQRQPVTALEPKYDGFRCQIHVFDGRVEIFSRGLDRTTDMLPEIAEAALAQIKGQPAILEGEAVSYDPQTGEYHPFQVTAQRKRKHKVSEWREQVPLRLFAFDLLMHQGEPVADLPYTERRRRLAACLGSGETIVLADSHLVEDAQAVERYFQQAISEGLEGIMAKRPDSPYEAGKRGFDWLKLKRVRGSSLADTLDAVVVGYDRGRGRRGAWGIGSVLLAVYDPDGDRYLTIAKAASGLTDSEWLQTRQMLDEIALEAPDPRVTSLYQPDVWVDPLYVLEVVADEITQSPMHTAGYALRFPRLIGLPKGDRQPEQATTLGELARLYQLQRRA